MSIIPMYLLMQTNSLLFPHYVSLDFLKSTLIFASNSITVIPRKVSSTRAMYKKSFVSAVDGDMEVTVTICLDIRIRDNKCGRNRALQPPRYSHFYRQVSPQFKPRHQSRRPSIENPSPISQRTSRNHADEGARSKLRNWPDTDKDIEMAVK